MWWEKKLPVVGEVLFRNDFPPRPEDFAFLEAQGIASKPDPKNAPGNWTLQLSHPTWGTADLMYRDDVPLPPRELFEHVLIPQSDRDAAISCKTHVGLAFESSKGHILRDRKLMLRFVNAVMADHGAVAIDNASRNVWTRDMLQDELSHDADLDVEAIYSIHAVGSDDDEIHWLHTHGLAEVGRFDFDILQPSSDVMLNIGDVCRAIAFHILEEDLGPSTERFQLVRPRGDIRMVGMDTFLRSAEDQWRKGLGPMVEESHRRKRSVVCEPEPSLLGRLFRTSKLQPARLLTGSVPDNPMFGFSTAASDLMAERARGTYPLLRSLHREFAEFEFPCIVKLGFRIDGGSETDKEHMWFEVHEPRDGSIDCTCVNTPYRVSSLHEGQRGEHPVDLLSDWVIMTPAGNITPRSSNIARIIRSRADEMRQLLKENS